MPFSSRSGERQSARHSPEMTNAPALSANAADRWPVCSRIIHPRRTELKIVERRPIAQEDPFKVRATLSRRPEPIDNRIVLVADGRRVEERGQYVADREIRPLGRHLKEGEVDVGVACGREV